MSRLMQAAALAAALILGSWAGAAMADSGLSAPPTPSGKVAPAQPGPETLDLGNSVEGEATTEDAAPKAVFRSGCILPNRSITYNIILRGRGTFRFRTVPDRFFDVVMTLNFPGFFRRVDRFFEGGAETLLVRKPFRAPVSGTVRISGFRGSFGCFNLRITP